MIVPHYFPTVRPDVDLYSTSMYTTNCCACDLCWDHEQNVSLNLSGPHDLHCVCPICLRDDPSPHSIFSMFENRHLREPTPDEVFTLLELLVDIQANLLDNSYTTPPNSPTNKEMHAYNGNHSDQHDNGSANFLRAAVRGLHPRANSADRFAAGALAQTSLIGGGLTYSAFKDMGKPLNELREQIFGRVGPTHLDIVHKHDQNRKHKHVKIIDKVHGDKQSHDQSKILHKLMDLRGTEHNIVNVPVHPTSEELHKLRSKEHNVSLVKHGPTNKEMHATNGNGSSPFWYPGNPSAAEQADHPNDMLSLINVNGEDGYYWVAPGDNSDRPPRVPSTTPVNPAPVQPNPPIGPTNRDMHSYNGNIKSKKQIKVKHRKKKFIPKTRVKNKPKIVIKETVKKYKGEKRAIKKDNQELVLAKKYARALRMPCVPFPRLGSTGNLPTKIVHGFYEITFPMSLPGIGGQPTLTNCTDLIVYMSPKLFLYTNTPNGPSDYMSPISIGVGINSTTTFINTASTNSFFTTDYANVTALKNETGCNTATTFKPAARFLGGHVSLICRCPMASTAPPFLFGGLLPQNLATIDGTSVERSKQLNVFSTTTIRSLTCTNEVAGFEVSSVYVPANSKHLTMGPNVATYSIGSYMDVTPIPYVGMTGCPTTANVTVLASGYFEIAQNEHNIYYQGGWGLGPRVSAEDIFDNLPRINSVQAKAIPLGNKNNSNTAAPQMQLLQTLNPPEETVQNKLEKLKEQFEILTYNVNKLKLEIPKEDEFEDEKYFDSSPNYKNLSKSTIDLALSLKDKLTPGSVTSKTVRSSLP